MFALLSQSIFSNHMRPRRLKGAWFSHLLRHPAKRWSASKPPEPTNLKEFSVSYRCSAVWCTEPVWWWRRHLTVVYLVNMFLLHCRMLGYGLLTLTDRFNPLSACVSVCLSCLFQGLSLRGCVRYEADDFVKLQICGAGNSLVCLIGHQPEIWHSGGYLCSPLTVELMIIV